MNKDELQKIIDECHRAGKKVAAAFCYHVPEEIFEAAGICLLHVPYMHGVLDAASRLLPNNVCPAAKNCCDTCEDECLKNADLIIAETSCDGKRKMYELISRQDRVYFYQVAQGADRNYVKPLIKSECRHLVTELEKRFNLTITEEAIRKAGALLNRERESIVKLMEIQCRIPPTVWGTEIFRALEVHRTLPDIHDRIAANDESRKQFLARESPVPKSAGRILVTGCPLSGVFTKILNAIEQNGGVAVCLETCEVMKSAIRHFDTKNEDVYAALADCYQNTACAIMAPNTLRFQLIERLAAKYHVDGILDVMLTTCHPYTVERDKMSRLCKNQLHIPYIPVSTDTSESDIGQLTTRITAFMEML